ncbi:uncharacterized protein LOC115634649 [Scaptodrosophila lebanonensis]|uniref:Uncharacterized protein LOC115634649 n=1 Tax=Drosophila lebanonensis TaxID=7225 RepID=A0A6J2UJJ6_DROLE|nr:uncharacterized protein LOC115634649 [Scaptodrosophila lebanonensis]
MGRQSKLVLLLVLCPILLQTTYSSTPKPNAAIHLVHDDILDNELDSGEADTISMPKIKQEQVESITKIAGKPKPSTTEVPVSEEIPKDEGSKLDDHLKTESVKSSKNNSSEGNYEYGDYEYDDDDDEYENYDNEEVESTSVRSKNSKTKNVTPKLHTTEEESSSKPKAKNGKAVENKENAIDNDSNYDDYDEDENSSDEDDESDNIADEEVVFSENVPCARYCVCSRNVNSYLVATCSRLDPGTQKFGSDISDLVVTNVGPKYPILMGPKFFHQLGLKKVVSIKIANCTIEYMHPEAFHGLEDLYAVNLTNAGLAIISPDTFDQNKKLRMLTISGNDLSIMSTVHYLLKSSSVEELDFSRNNLMELNPNAFSHLSNIVYINLAQNGLMKIPKNVFDSVETIEELDLSYNSLKELPENIFNRTALAILHLKYNSFTGDLKIAGSDLQQLDLSFNSITQVHHSMFDKMTGLTNLNLKGNGIKKIQPDSFLSLKSLRHIDLSINDLDQLSSMLFFKNSELDVIRMNDNPRLSQLPTDGFISYNGYFTVYFLDISNCAIGALGHKTFSTMPHLTTLKLAWNNINSLPRDIFASLTKLIDLDLSNNLISKLDELIFMENNEITKLNLAGNPINKLSVRLFMPLHQLRSLDMNDCELVSLLSDKQFGTDYKFFETLRSFNASGNLIRKISPADIKSFKNLRSLDITHNPLKCNDDFQDFISYASLHTQIMPRKVPALANLQDDVTLVEIETQASWAQLARDVCKHNEMLHKDEKLEKRIEEADKKVEEDERKLFSIMDASAQNKNKQRNMDKIMKGTTNAKTDKDDALSGSAEEDQNNGGEDKEDDNGSEYDTDDDVDDDADDDDDDDDDDEDNNGNDDEVKENTKVHIKTRGHFKVTNHGLKVEEVELSKETRDKFLLNKLGLDNDDLNSDEEEIIIERGHIYYNGYSFMIPIILLVTCVVVILLAIVKVVTMILRRRGERYRMALLAPKNPFVYQKLSEDIVKPAIKEQKQPKVHRYAPINQV